jgi:hypothetical protein
MKKHRIFGYFKPKLKPSKNYILHDDAIARIMARVGSIDNQEDILKILKGVTL